MDLKWGSSEGRPKMNWWGINESGPKMVSENEGFVSQSLKRNEMSGIRDYDRVENTALPNRFLICFIL